MQIPGYLENSDKLKAAGVDEVTVLSRAVRLRTRTTGLQRRCGDEHQAVRARGGGSRHCWRHSACDTHTAAAWLQWARWPVLPWRHHQFSSASATRGDTCFRLGSNQRALFRDGTIRRQGWEPSGRAPAASLLVALAQRVALPVNLVCPPTLLQPPSQHDVHFEGVFIRAVDRQDLLLLLPRAACATNVQHSRCCC